MVDTPRARGTARLVSYCLFILLSMMVGQAMAYYTKSKETPLLDGIYPEYPPVKPATGDKAKLIKKGEYLAKIGDCLACHTNTKAGGKPFAGGLPINTPFGTFYSPNITPDKETGIGNWTADDMIRAIQEGRDPHGANYFPVFPYVYFSKMTKDDIRALHEYLQNVPAVKRENTPQPFPFNVPGARLSLWGWNLLFFFPDKGVYEYDPAQSKEWNRGAYIVNGLGHCSMCHTPLNVLGAPKNRYFLTGGFVDGFWAPNITKFGLAEASHIDVANVFKKDLLVDGAGVVAGPMAEVNHDSLQYLTESDQRAISVYLKTVVSEEYLGVKPSKMKPSLRRGRQVYINACIICHQDGKMGAPVIGNSDGFYRRLKEQGLQALYRHTIKGFNSMPPKGACVTCSDNDVKSAVDYLLSESLSRSQWADIKAGKGPKFKPNGAQIYNENCALCHDSGKQGAPKLGDTQVWKHLLKQNVDVLMENTIRSAKHPKNGGCRHCQETEVIAAIKYMLDKSGTGGNYLLW